MVVRACEVMDLSTSSRMIFVTGAPRSGTTFVSDWITESTDAYCAHEILEDIAGKTDEQIISYMWYCAATGVDRLSKPLQREFMRWNVPKTKTSPSLLGFKEPLIWPIVPDQMPYPVSGFLEKFDARYIVLIRHPYDVIASGKHRAICTRNWPNFSVEEHCLFWLDAVVLYDFYVERGFKALCIRWEKLITAFTEVKEALGQFLNLTLPEFHGYEHTFEHIQSLRKQVSLTEGLKGDGKRELLTQSDLEIIRLLTADSCASLGYSL
jgi:hypothetical protein